MQALNPDSYKKEKWLYGTPVVLPEQVKIELVLISFDFIFC
jgi:hypothetical protein